MDNSADLASRGTNPSTRLTSNLWWNGPSWLLSFQETSNTADLPEPVNPPPECLKEMKVQVACQELGTASLIVKNSSQVGISQIMNCNNYSDVFKLYRVTGHILRFVGNLKARSAKLNCGVVMSGPLSIEELATGELLWIREMQETLKPNARFAQKCIQLGVVTDGDGIMRCKGRLGKSTLPPSAKYPIWIPADHHVTRLIIKDCHHRVMHNGVLETLMELRSSFWVIRGRQVVRKVIYSCSVCRRHEGQSYRAEPLSDLPEFRLKEGHPFASTGVDFAGPIFVKFAAGRETQFSKAYMCLFTCGSTRAVHIELTPNPTTAAFIRCLRRLVARRGNPELLISDNAKTFKAASAQLAKIFNDPDTVSFMLKQKIEWRFNLEKAPWWGGFFERMIKSTKRCLKKTLGKARLTYEELCTVLAEVECILNSRPLTYMYPDELEEPLTPSHLISGRRMLSLPDTNTRGMVNPTSTQETVSRRARYLQTLMNHFWYQWRRDYLPALRESHRVKEASPGHVVQQGDVVSIHDENLPRTLWRTGVVHELIKGTDDKTRGAVIRVADKGKTSFLRRPVQRLFPFEIRDEPATETQSHVENMTVKEQILKEPIKESVQATQVDSPSRPRRHAAQEGEQRRRLLTNACGALG